MALNRFVLRTLGRSKHGSRGRSQFVRYRILRPDGRTIDTSNDHHSMEGTWSIVRGRFGSILTYAFKFPVVGTTRKMTTIARIVEGRIETTSHEPRSSTLCWHCCHAFDTEPIPFPYKWDDRRNVFTVCGAFCSFACVCGYNRDRGKLHNGKNCGMQIFQMYKQVTGGQKPPPCAPPRNFLQAFGGHMTIDEFRSVSESIRYIELPSNCTVHKSMYLETPRSDGPKSIRSGTNAFVNATTRASEIRVPRTAGGDERQSKRKKTMLELALGM